MRLASELLLLSLVSILFLGPVHLFVSYRLQQARRRGAGRGYVALADPWLVPVIALTGLALNALLWVFH